MKRRWLIKGAAVFVLTAGIWTGEFSTSVQAAAQTTTTAEANTYDAVFKIPNSAVTSIKNNAGHYGQSTIEKAIDGKTGTHWETNKPNSNTFKNMVTIGFDDTYEISEIRYLVRQDGGKPKGFPLEYNLYYSTTENGEDFQLLKSGSYSSAAGTEISIEVPPTQLKRVRLEFVKAYNNWASMAEISFYRYDSLKEEMGKVFADNTYSSLSEEYKSEEKLKSLVEEAKSHPNKDRYLRLLEDAQAILQDENVFADKLFTPSPRGDYSKERQRTKTNSALFGFDSTGYYVTPGETIHVYVEAAKGSKMPQLMFGQIAKDKNGWRRAFTLKPGENEITAQSFDKMNPAAIYFYNPAIEGEQELPVIRLEGGTKFPLYVHGETDPADFQAELETYLKNVSYNDNDFDNGNPNGYYYNIAEVASKNCTISTTASGCLKGITAVSGKTIADTMDLWEDMYYTYAKYSGFDTEDTTSVNYMPRGKFTLRVFCQGPYGWAENGYTGYNGGNSAKRDDQFFASIVSYNAIAKGGWAVFHENGHLYDNSALGIGESTNNLYSLMMQDKYLENNRLVTGELWKNKIEPFHMTLDRASLDGKNIWTYLAIVNQLELVYGRDDIYGKAQRIMREDTANKYKGLNKYEKMAVAISLAAGVDVTGHFEYYGLPIGTEAKAFVSDLPAETRKTYYVNKAYTAKDAAAFSNPQAKPVVTASGSGKVELKISMDEPDNALLCYEVYRNGEFMGITRTNTFVDKNTEENTVYSYTVIAYDRKLNATPESEAVEKNASEPSIQQVKEGMTALYQDFDPMDYIEAKDAKGSSLISQVKVTENTVDINTRGEYQVTYQVSDESGNKTSYTMPMKVVSLNTYLSDMEWTSAKAGWGQVRKDMSTSQNAISLLGEIGEKTYKKGIGTHANSEVIYNIEGSGAQRFESYVGVDGKMRSTNTSSVIFEVYVDGEKQYDSGLMKKGTKEQFVSVDVEGAKELKLVVKDGGNGNGGDHADWAEARLVSENSKPVITGEIHASIRPGEEVDLSSGVSAYDVEDLDLTEQIQVQSDIDVNVPGIYDVVYQVTDSDGNRSEKTGSVAVVNGSVYVSDTDWQKAQAGWGSVNKDLSVSGKSLSLNSGNGQWQSFEKGVGTHANSQIIYDLTDKNYFAFESYVGVDGAMKKSGVSSIIFRVYVDGELQYDSGLMKSSTPMEYVHVNLNGASTLKLVVDNGGNGNGSDHADWADAKFLIWIDKSELGTVIEEAEKITADTYTQESFEVFTSVLEDAKAVYEDETADEQKVQDVLQALKDAMVQLSQKADKSQLQAAISQAGEKNPDEYTEESYLVLTQALESAGAVNADEKASQEQVDAAVSQLVDAIEQLVARRDTEALTDILDYIAVIDSMDYVAPGLSHPDIRLYNVQCYAEEAKKVLENPNIEQAEVDRYVKGLESFIEDLGQEYQPGQQPVNFGLE